MKHRFTRQELYDLVWSKPMTHLAAELGVSVGVLSALLRRADIPKPSPGHWMRIEFGKPIDHPAIKAGGKSIRFGQACFGAQFLPSRMRVFASSMSFRMMAVMAVMAVMATFAGFPAFRMASYLAFMSGLKRMATRAGM